MQGGANKVHTRITLPKWMKFGTHIYDIKLQTGNKSQAVIVKNI